MGLSRISCPRRKHLWIILPVREGPLENLWGGGGREIKKTNIRARETEMKKNSCTPINPKKYSCYGLKKNSYPEFDNEKKILRLENSPPAPTPHNFSNGPSLKAICVSSLAGRRNRDVLKFIIVLI